MRLKSLQSNDDNSYIGNIYQIGPKNLKNFCMTKILKQFVDPKTYDYLRSKYQLGYAVGCGIEQNGEVLGFNVVVLSQEHKHRFNAVQIKIDDFMENTITNAIDELDDAEFEKFKDAYVKELQAEVLTLDSEIGKTFLNYFSNLINFNILNRCKLRWDFWGVLSLQSQGAFGWNYQANYQNWIPGILSFIHGSG